MSTLVSTLDIMRAIKSASKIKVGRNFEGFFADRIVHAITAPSLLDAVEALAKGMDASIEYVGGKRTAAFMVAAHAEDAPAVLQWLREHPRIAAMVAGLRNDDDYRDACEAIQVSPVDATDDSVVTAVPSYQVSIRAELLAPLAHGSDGKAGNATLFRRRQVITETGRILNLPYYSGNAIRGQMRDLLADHLLSNLGLTPRRDNPPLSIWFFHCLYAGGVLEEQSKAMGAINKEMGKSGSLRTDGLRRLRDMLPGLSLLGTAIGNRVIPGRVSVGDLRPQCHEWGTGNVPAAQLMQWEFLTRRDDYEGKGEDDTHAGMIANTECLRDGVVLAGGIDIDSHANEIERGALAVALNLVASRGMLGAENRRGLGKVRFAVDGTPDPEPYRQYLADNRASILDYLNEIGALHAPGTTDLLSA